MQRGQKLVELEKPLYIAQRDRLRAELASRRVEVQRAPGRARARPKPRISARRT